MKMINEASQMKRREAPSKKYKNRFGNDSHYHCFIFTAPLVFVLYMV